MQITFRKFSIIYSDLLRIYQRFRAKFGPTRLHGLRAYLGHINLWVVVILADYLTKLAVQMVAINLYLSKCNLLAKQ